MGKRTKVLLGTCLALGTLWMLAAQQGWAAKVGLFQAHKDIGATPKKGGVKYDSKQGVYLVRGGGANIWGKTDAFQFVYKPVNGDFSLTADVALLGQSTEAHRKAGLMVRQSLDPDSPYVDVLVHGDGLVALQYRETPDSMTLEKRSDVKNAKEIRIERRGNHFTIAAGNPGQELKITGPLALAFHEPVLVGLAVCAHNAETVETAQFSNVKIGPVNK